jgi:DNA-binding MarR family transcriptional regulator
VAVGPIRWLDEAEQRTWRNLLWATRLLFESLDRQLQRDSGIPHTYYIVLAALSEAPERTLTMGQLAELVHASPSRLSHAVARLERAGWITRIKRPPDRRTTLARLTDEGAAMIAAAAPGHVAAVRRHLFDRITPEQVRVLGDAFEAVRAGLDADRPRQP